MGGVSGLDYTPVFNLLDRVTQADPDPRQAWDQLFDDIQHLERAALDAIRDNAK
jgi:hypothetical protein